MQEVAFPCIKVFFKKLKVANFRPLPTNRTKTIYVAICLARNPAAVSASLTSITPICTPGCLEQMMIAPIAEPSTKGQRGQVILSHLNHIK